MWEHLIRIITACSLLGILVTWLIPVHSKFISLAFLGSVTVVWLGCTIMLWKRKRLRAVALLLPLIVAVPVSLPGRVIDSEELREDYVSRMAEYEGAEYYWGGESARGIDCSGLPRRSLRDALLAHGLKHFNGRAFRKYVEQWWFDASAKALGEGYRNYTIPMAKTGTIQEMDYDGLIPGDLAVTTSGIHVLAYAGNGKWIQADPKMGIVATLDGRSSDNGWFRSPVTIHRWQFFAEQASGEQGSAPPH